MDVIVPRAKKRFRFFEDGFVKVIFNLANISDIKILYVHDLGYPSLTSSNRRYMHRFPFYGSVPCYP